MIFREQTAVEKKDYVNLMSSPEPNLETIYNIEVKFNKENRKLLALSLNPKKESPSCWRCWRLEFEKTSATADFDKEYPIYKNRSDLIDIRKVASGRANAMVKGIKIKPIVEFEICFSYSCNYCKSRQNILFKSDIFSEEVIKTLQADLEGEESF